MHHRWFATVVLGLGLAACGGDDEPGGDPGTGAGSTGGGADGGSTGTGGSGTGAGQTGGSGNAGGGSGGAGNSGGTGNAGGGPVEPTSGELSLLCYNVHGLPAAVTGDDTPGRMTAIGPLLDDFDVVALQEDFMAANHAILTGASSHIFDLWFDAKVDPTRVYGSGLSIFSNPLLADQHQEHFTTCAGIIDGANDCLSSKGFMMARLQLAAGMQVDVYDTHLDAGGGNDDDDARAEQVDQMLAAIDLRSAGRAVVLCGDMNLEEDDPDEAPTLQHLIDAGGFTDSCEAVACPEPGRIERILFRSSGDVSLSVQSWTNEPAFDNGGSPLSDHPAISVVFDWDEP